MVLTLENGANFSFNTDGCRDMDFLHHPSAKWLINKDTEGDYFPTFDTFYEKYALKIVK